MVVLTDPVVSNPWRVRVVGAVLSTEVSGTETSSGGKANADSNLGVVDIGGVFIVGFLRRFSSTIICSAFFFFFLGLPPNPFALG